jgi:hypothetical protein
MRLEGLRTNLVVGDGLPQTLKKPGSLFVVLNTVGELPQLSFDARELARGNSVPSLRVE